MSGAILILKKKLDWTIAQFKGCQHLKKIHFHHESLYALFLTNLLVQ